MFKNLLIRTVLSQSTDVKHKHLLMLAGRVCFLVLILLSVALLGVFKIIDFSDSFGFIHWIIAGLFTLCGVTGLYLLRFQPGKIYQQIHTDLDICLITGLIYLTGGPLSPHTLAYLPYILAYSLLFGRKESIKTALSCVGVFTLLSILLISQKLTLISGSYLTGITTFNLLSHSSLILILSLAIIQTTDSLSKKVINSTAEAAESLHSLSELKGKYNFELLKLKSVEKQLIAQDKMAKLLSDTRRTEAYDKPLEHFIGDSKKLLEVFDIISKVSKSESNILISGESGTGKELVARSIHVKSNRNEKPFIAVNCSAIPENLIESEFFGHKKGSFTGANSDTPGLFKMATGGTLFLDEIGELPIHMQSKLLRAIQEKTIRSVGGSEEIPVDVRILSATNRNLFEETKKGHFREDLFYRINVVQIALPPLRDRREDIPLLVNHFIGKFCDQEHKPLIPPGTLKLLTEYSYPGNIRELENIIERAVILGGSAILPEHLPNYISNHNEGGLYSELSQIADGSTFTRIIENDNLIFPLHLDDILDNIEKKYLMFALKQTKGVRKKAAELLGINFRSFRYRMSKFEEEKR